MPSALLEASAALTDAPYVVRARNGDREAFSYLFAQYYQRVFAYLLVRVCDRPVAEDLASETFTRGLAGLGTLKHDQFEAWIITVAHNVWCSHLKATQREIPYDTTSQVLACHDSPDPAAVAEAEERIRAVSRAMLLLTYRERQCLRLHLYEGRSIREVANTMNMSEPAFSVFKWRTLKIVRHILQNGQRPLMGRPKKKRG